MSAGGQWEIWTVPPPWSHSNPRRVERRTEFATREAAEVVADEYEKRAHKNAFEVRSPRAATPPAGGPK